MNVIRVRHVPESSFGEEVVLVAVDSAGLDTFLTTLFQAEQHGSSCLDHDGTVHDFQITPGAADIELHDDRVLWRMDHARAIEIIEKLRALRGGGPGHHYVDDMSSPTHTLVLSQDEYISPSWLTAGKEPLFG
jgi:hypothetical protein